MIQELLRPRFEIGNIRFGRWHTIDTQDILPSRMYVRTEGKVIDVTKGGCFSSGDRFEDIAVIDDDTVELITRDLSEGTIDPVAVDFVTKDRINSLGIGRLRWVPA